MKISVLKLMALLVSFATIGMVGEIILGQNRLAKVFETANLGNVNTVPSIIALDDAAVSFGRLRVRTYRYALNTDPAKMAEIDQKIKEAQNDVEQALARYEGSGCEGKSCISDDKDRQLLTEVTSAYKDYLPVLQKILEFSRQNKNDEARSALTQNAAQAERLNDALQSQMDYKKTLALQGMNDAASTMSGAKLILNVMGGIILFLIALIGWLITRNLMQQLGGELQILTATVNKIAEGDFSSAIELKDGDSVSAMAALKKIVLTLQSFQQEMQRLTSAAKAGQLSVRAKSELFQGGYRDIAGDVNQMLEDVIQPLNVAADYVDNISRGNIPAKITDSYNGDFNTIKNNLNNCIDAISNMVAEARNLEKAAVEGRLETRADVSQYQGDYRKIVQGVNNTLDAVIGPLNVTADYVDQISKGVIPAVITDNYNGDFNIIKTNLNNVVKMMSNLLAQTDIIIKAAADGELDKRADATLFVGGWNKLVSGVNDTITNIVNPLNVTADYVDQIAKGVIPPIITAEYKGQYNIIKGNLNAAVKMMNDLLAQTDIIIKAAADGELDKRADATLFVGGWNKLVSGVNDTITNIVNPLNVTADYVDQIAKGVIPPIITAEYKGQYNIIKGNLNAAIKMMNDLLAQTDIIIKAAADGQLDKRADATLFVGGWNTLVSGVNDTITNIVNPLNVTADYVDQIAKGVIPPIITAEYKGQYNIIKGNLNAAVKMMNDLLAQTDIIIKAAADGQLDKRADATLFVGGWNTLVSGVNDTITNIVNPLNVTADYVDQIAKGKIPPVITAEYKGQYNIIKGNLNAAVKMMNDLLAQTDIIIKAAADGELDKRADATLFVGGWNTLVSGVNDTITNIVNPLNVTADYVDQIAKGKIPPLITAEYKGQYNIIKGNLNAAVKMMNDLLAQTDIIIKAAADGELDKRADATLFVGGWNTLVSGVNDTITNIVNPLNVAADYVDKISKGNIPPKITDPYNGDFNILKNNLNTCIDAVNALIADAGMLANAAVEGKLETRADATKHQGDFRKIVVGVNNTLDAVIGPLNVAANYVERISKGDTPPKITDTYNGDFNLIKNNLNLAIDAINQQAAVAEKIANGDLSVKVNIRSENDILAKSLQLVLANLNAVIADTDSLIKAAAEGQLGKRADATKHQGDYHNLITGINQILDGIVIPVNESIEVLTLVEQGDLTQSVKGDYKGQLGDFKNTVNNTITKLAQTIAEVISAADQLGNASQQISATSQSLSQASSEQAASVEETSASIEEMAASINQNADNAKITDSMAGKAAKEASEGGVAVKQTVSAMSDIANKIGIIDDIAYQTNMLALNAAIEAARAGDHGKGFAVVAAEVRKLAERSQIAAQEIGTLAESSVKTAESAGQLLDEIVPSIAKTSDLVQEIAAASKEQSAGVSQVNTAMNQMSQITQQNASASEELAATAEEMTSQVEQLQTLMSFFKISLGKSALDHVASTATMVAPKVEKHKPAYHKEPHFQGVDLSKFDRF